MARALTWYEATAAYADASDQTAHELISESDMEDLVAATITRIVCSFDFMNDATQQNQIWWGLLVTDARTLATDYPDVKDVDNAALPWLQRGCWHFNGSTTGLSEQNGVKHEFDIRVQRKIRRGQVLVMIVDDTAGDYARIGSWYRVLVRAS